MLLRVIGKDIKWFFRSIYQLYWIIYYFLIFGLINLKANPWQKNKVLLKWIVFVCMWKTKGKKKLPLKIGILIENNYSKIGDFFFTVFSWNKII